ncbi:MAG: hypothetical protein OXP36_05965 [Gammaproteobacteria bacterium]|nr:hypothetical protein [Gammaproteobacteria bacterium]
MTAAVIDTLRYADRLKRAGVEPGQAEGMSRALNDELTEGLVTRKDLDDAVTGLKGDLNDAVKELRGDIDGLGNRIEVLETKFDSKFDGVDAKFDAVDARFEAMDAKFDALRSQNKHVFLVLALIAGLGLYNAAAPHLLGKNVHADRSSLAAPTAQTTADPTKAASTPGS